MNKIAIFFSVLIVTQLAFCIVMMKIKISSLEFEKEILEKRNEKLHLNLDIQKKMYKQEIEKLRSVNRISKSIEIPKGTIEAVRYAMIHNHPDNGGSTEKFILYKNCYDKLIGGR